MNLFLAFRIVNKISTFSHPTWLFSLTWLPIWFWPIFHPTRLYGPARLLLRHVRVSGNNKNFFLTQPYQRLCELGTRQQWWRCINHVIINVAVSIIKCSIHTCFLFISFKTYILYRKTKKIMSTFVKSSFQLKISAVRCIWPLFFLTETGFK